MNLLERVEKIEENVDTYRLFYNLKDSSIVMGLTALNHNDDNLIAINILLREIKNSYMQPAIYNDSDVYFILELLENIYDSDVALGLDIYSFKSFLEQAFNLEFKEISYLNSLNCWYVKIKEKYILLKRGTLFDTLTSFQVFIIPDINKKDYDFIYKKDIVKQVINYINSL